MLDPHEVTITIPPRADASLHLTEPEDETSLGARLRVTTGRKQWKVSGPREVIRELARFCEDWQSSEIDIDKSERQALLVTARRAYLALDGRLPDHLMPRKRRNKR